MSTQAQSTMTLDSPYVDYAMIIPRLLASSRLRRQQWAAHTGLAIKSQSEVYDLCTVAIHGGRQTGKTRHAIRHWSAERESTIVVVYDEAMKLSFLDRIAEAILIDKKEVGQSIFTAREVIKLINQYDPVEPSSERTQITLTLDDNDPQPEETLRRLMHEFQEKRQALLTRQLPERHPLRTVKTVIVDDHFHSERTQGLTFARLVRFAQLGGQMPEFILLS